MSALTFDAETHTYTYAGAVVPSVTQILKPLTNFDHIPKHVLEGARDRGVKVHAAVEFINQGILGTGYGLDEESLDPMLAGYVRQYRKFLAATGFEVTGCEQRVFNEGLFYAGTVDLLGRWQQTTWVCDVKSGAIPKSVGPQLSAYQMALPERPRRRLTLQLKPDTYNLQESTNLADWPCFQSCLNIHNWSSKL